jgi:hypothetical protein
MSDPGWDERNKTAWALVRLVLGLAQIMGATAAAYLVLTTGLNELSLGVTLFTCLCTSVSVLLFGGRKDGKE